MSEETIYDWAMCDPETGNIEYVMSVNSLANYEQAGYYQGLRTFKIPGDTNITRAMDESYYDYEAGAFETRLKQPTRYYKWTKDKVWALDSTQLMIEFREQRNQRLGMCEWTQGPDSPLSDDKKAEWATYRQALRDTTKNLKEDFDTPDGFVWPTAPS